MGSETLSFSCYILSDESGIPFYSTSNGYKKKLHNSKYGESANNYEQDTILELLYST